MSCKLTEPKKKRIYIKRSKELTGKKVIFKEVQGDWVQTLEAVGKTGTICYVSEYHMSAVNIKLEDGKILYGVPEKYYKVL